MQWPVLYDPCRNTKVEKDIKTFFGIQKNGNYHKSPGMMFEEDGWIYGPSPFGEQRWWRWGN